MKKIIIDYVFKLGITTVVISIILGCASLLPTKPNTIYSQYPGYNQIFQENPLLANEIGKLPEIQDAISDDGARALEDIVKLYQDNPIAFNKVFDEMYKIGLPDVRKYCSPLQALFWLAEDGRLSEENNPLVDYSLEGLLNEAWKPEGKLELSENEAKKVIDGIKNEDQRKEYNAFLDRLKVLNKIILLDYRKKPRTFSKEARAIIKNSSRENLRWEDFNVVVERLNAPELVDYYERRRINWVDWRTLPYYPDYPVSPQYVFKHNKGNCVAITDFTVYCLHKGGYKARDLRVFDPNYSSHSVCLFKVNRKKYIMDNGRISKRGIIPWAEYHYKPP